MQWIIAHMPILLAILSSLLSAAILIAHSAKSASVESALAEIKTVVDGLAGGKTPPSA